MRLFFALFALTAVLFTSCEESPVTPKQQRKKAPFTVSNPSDNAQLVVGDQLEIRTNVVDGQELKQLQLFLGDSLLNEQKNVGIQAKYSLATKDLNVGFHTIRIVGTDAEGEEFIVNRTIALFSDIYPELKVAKIMRTYPHQTTSYTQGLEMYNGKLYEGTGQTGKSKLMEIRLETGETIRSVDVPDYIFGEGITILNDEIFQITWEARKCFVYDVNSFELKREFQYFGEGWGIANDGKHLIMSNGSSEVVFRDPKTFDIVRSIQIFGSSQEYRAINELEYLNGFIYANVYQEDYVLKIDPANGKVLEKIDCGDVVREGKGSGDVLNGIAYNTKTGNFILTGKNWSKFFEVQFVNP